ncbi:MAG TPA: DUF1778 domain-containing protein [Thermoanaerobaculia bacterium]|nr:DUF1778 domain-containing protein [Thermoanaerobaculia bacterium]
MSTNAASRRDEGNELLSDEQTGQFMPESEPIVLTARDWEAFLAAWDDADRPRPRLEALMRRHGNCRLSDVG